MGKVTPLGGDGAAGMADGSDSAATARATMAQAPTPLSPEALHPPLSPGAPKGDVLATARIAGIIAAKKTSELIPLCHPIPLSKAAIEFEPHLNESSLRIVAIARTTAQTGVEMEALVAASIAALTVY